MLTKDKIIRKIRLLKKFIDYLYSKRNITFQQFKENYEVQSAIERNLQLAIECCIDIGEIIISEEWFDKPEDYKNVILILGENGVIPQDFAKHFCLTASLRNLLAHLYEDIDLSLVHDFQKNNLKI
ncbi:MAG: type VII toxin-antitoxin system HepT family RNase toxin, partial [Promethearchaeota archaeon]